MLAELLRSRRKQFDALAERWLEFGVTSFSVWAKGDNLCSWPPEFFSSDDYVKQEIKIRSQAVGELRVTGVDSPLVRRWLETDANLIADLVELENDLINTTIELVDTRDQLLALYELTRATRDCWEIDETLKHLAVQAARIIKGEAAFVYINVNGEYEGVSHYPTESLDREAVTEWALKMRDANKPILLNRSMGERLPGDLVNMMLMPIHIFEVPEGVLAITNKLGNDFMSPDVKLAQAITEFAGSQLENVIMYQANLEQARLETEMELAHDVQSRLLPGSPPSIEGLDIWASSNPASHVGGDFYDFFTDPNDSLTFVVGDISGKGMPAALVMAITRTVVRMLTVVQPAHRPEEIIERSNSALYDDLNGLGMFVTAIIAQYDPLKKMLSYANAGHSPVIYRPVNGEAVILEADGTALGVLQESLSVDQTITLGQGDLLVIGTDGLFNIDQNNKLAFGYDWLLSEIDRLSIESARTIADNIMKISTQQHLDPFEMDDQTLVVLKVVG
jgi:sigma-B regulation protein RsbU (phosphoserine phosphatase)